MVDLEEERRQSIDRQAARGEPLPASSYVQEEPVEAGPTGEALADQRAAAASGYVQQVRREAFGKPGPPFKSMRDVPTEAVRAVAVAEEKISRGTGFAKTEVRAWILTGARPRLPRAVLGITGINERLPDDTLLQRKVATITIHAPVTEAEVRRIWRRLNRGWTDAATGPDFASVMMLADEESPAASPAPAKRRAPQMTSHDREVLHLVRETPDLTWQQRADRWQEEHGEEKLPDTLSKAYRRAAAKLDRVSGKGKD